MRSFGTFDIEEAAIAQVTKSRVALCGWLGRRLVVRNSDRL